MFVDKKRAGEFWCPPLSSKAMNISCQTTKNKELLEAGSEVAHNLQLEKMRKIKADPILRKAFLREQAMYKSLEDARQKI